MDNQTVIIVSGRINWVSDDGKIAIIQGFGYVYADRDVASFFTKGDHVELSLRLWEKNMDNKGKVRRFYVQSK